MQDVPLQIIITHNNVNRLWTHVGQNCSHSDIRIVLWSARDRSTHFQRIFEQPDLTPVFGRFRAYFGLIW